MDNENDLSKSTRSFASSSYLSNGSSSNNASVVSTSSDPVTHLQSLGKLSGNLEKLLFNADYDYTDAEIVVEGVPVGVHRCILAARSEFFHQLFVSGSKVNIEEGKPKYLMNELVTYGRVGYESFKVFLTYLYTGKINSPPREVATCVDEGCAHDACGPAINYAVELMYASSTFQMKELVHLMQRRLQNFVEKALVEDLIPILVAAFHCQLNPLLSQCIQRVARSDLDSVSLDKELPYEVSSEIKALRFKSEQDSFSCIVEDVDPIREKGIRNIHKALDADDVELVELLLRESTVTLDDAFALHYATAYCDPKVVKKILHLKSADLNLRNQRGYTILHVAARRKDLEVIVALFDHGASALQSTRDGQTAVSICRRLTQPKDYNKTAKQGEESNKDKLCVDVLEREMRRNSISGKVLMISQELPGDMDVLLKYLEDRVGLALRLFPAEAKTAMANADADLTAYSDRYIPQKVDLNESPAGRTKRLQKRMQHLLRTVETGRRYFPNCSDVLDNLLDDMPNELYLEEGTPEEQEMKKKRFMELKDEVKKAFYKDISKQPGLSPSSSSSSSPKKNKTRKVSKR